MYSAKNLKIFFLHGNLSNLEKYLKDEYRGNVKSYHIDKAGMNVEDEIIVRGKIFLYEKVIKRPDWFNDLHEIARPTERTREMEELFNSSPKIIDRAVLLITIKNQGNKTFALTFGNGKHLLDQNQIVSDFGLEVAKSYLSSDQIISIDTTSIDRKFFNAKRQSIEYLLPENLTETGTQNIVKNIYGSLIEENTDSNISLGGKDSLYFRTKMNLKKDLGHWLKLLSQKYIEEDYSLDMPEELVSVSKQVKEILDAKLGMKILNVVKGETTVGRQLQKIKIIPNVTFSLENFEGFYVSGIRYPRTSSHSDFSIDEINYFERLGKVLNTQQENFESILNKLKRDKIEVKFEDEDDLTPICSVYEALNFEITVESRKYVLVVGKWFEIDKQFYNDLQKYVNSIERADRTNSIEYIMFDKNKHKNEGKYNEALAEKNRTVNLDKKFFIPKSDVVKKYGLNPNSRIEICDVGYFNEHKFQFIHIKRRSGADGISHLLTQSKVSAELFINSKSEIIKHINGLIDSFNENSADSIEKMTLEDQRRGEIVLGIIERKDVIKKKNSTILTLLEMLALRHNFRTLEYWGFKCYLTFIPKKS